MLDRMRRLQFGVSWWRLPGAFLVALVGCSFPAGGATPGTDASGDASRPLADGVQPDGRPPTVPCAAADLNGAALCLEFEDDVLDGVLLDSLSKHDAIATGLQATTRPNGPAPSNAADIGVAASVRVAEDPEFDLHTAYTLSMWLNPHQLPPSGQVMGLFDRETQVAMVIGSDPDDGSVGAVLCIHTGMARREWTIDVPVDTWSFVACTWNDSTKEMCAARWSGPLDHQYFCNTMGQTPTGAGTRGLAIGHLSANGAATARLDGSIDSAMVWRRSLAADELCALAGVSAGCLPCDAGSCQ